MDYAERPIQLDQLDRLRARPIDLGKARVRSYLGAILPARPTFVAICRPVYYLLGCRENRPDKRMEYRRIDINGNALVVAFDMCSSTRLIEELTLRGDLSRYDRLVRVIKEYLAVAQKQVAFDPYKFNGDGWILLFPSTASGEAVFDCLQGLCEHYRSAIKKLVLPHLAVRPRINGLTFGIECGPLRRLTIFGQREYVGRPINVACRLQAAIKDNDGSPAYKALVSNAAYREYLGFSNKRVQVWKVNRKLRNIRGGSDVPWKKIEFLNRRAT